MTNPKPTSHDILTAGANAAMDIFSRVDKTKPELPSSLHTADLTDDKGVEYFLKKLDELETLYKKTEVHVYSPEEKLIAVIPSTNLEDGTDLTAGRSTMRNTLKGNLGTYKKIKVYVKQAGINYKR
jgi:hypothetical protein